MTFVPPDGGRAGDMSARDLVAAHIIAHHALSYQPAGIWQRVLAALGRDYKASHRAAARIADAAYDYADAFVAEKRRRDG